MTKEAYFEMCEQLNTEPIEEDIPLELSDFPEFVQSSLAIYSKLPDTYDAAVGKYSGKDYSLIFLFFELYDVERNIERVTMLDIMQIADDIRKDLSSKKVQEQLSNIQNNKKPRNT